jgi:adenine-specific DNA-methyltransferase
MVNKTSIQPAEPELPGLFAGCLGAAYATSVCRQYKKENGQFFTPVEIAGLIPSNHLNY